MEVTAEKLKRMVDYVEQTQPLVKTAAEREVAVAKRAPEVVDALIKAGTLDESSRERAIKSLQDPLKALESLEKIAARLKKSEEDAPPKPLGGPEKKVASADDKDMKESDRVYLRGLGLLG